MRGRTRTLSTLNADARKSVAIGSLDSVASGRIDRLPGGTRSTARPIGGGFAGK